MWWRHDVMSWRHVMTSQNLIYLSQLVDWLESWFFFCFHGFLDHWVLKNVIDFQFLWCRHIMTSCHDVTKPDLPISACRCAIKLILFLFPWFFLGHWVRKCYWFFTCVMLTSWRHVRTSFHDVTKPDSPISACRLARKLILFLFSWFFRSLSSQMLLIFNFCDAVTSWRHVMTSLNLIYLSQLVDVLESWFFFVSMVF